MTPSSAITDTAPSVITDPEGRRIALRRLTALDKLRLFKAAGPALAQNEPWLGMAVLACSVTAIDDVPVPLPINEAQIEAIVARLGDAGINAIAAAVDQDVPATAEVVASAGN